jgi:hypothetical protein
LAGKGRDGVGRVRGEQSDGVAMGALAGKGGGGEGELNLQHHPQAPCEHPWLLEAIEQKLTRMFGHANIIVRDLKILSRIASNAEELLKLGIRQLKTILLEAGISVNGIIDRAGFVLPTLLPPCYLHCSLPLATFTARYPSLHLLLATPHRPHYPHFPYPRYPLARLIEVAATHADTLIKPLPQQLRHCDLHPYRQHSQPEQPAYQLAGLLTVEPADQLQIWGRASHVVKHEVLTPSFQLPAGSDQGVQVSSKAGDLMLLSGDCLHAGMLLLHNPTATYQTAL